jgi:hypothetical protein
MFVHMIAQFAHDGTEERYDLNSFAAVAMSRKAYLCGKQNHVQPHVVP